MQKTNDVIGMGNILMDFLVEVDDKHLIEFNLKKGEMHLVEHEKAQALLHKLKQYELKIEMVPGGSVANTLRGIGILGGNAILCGKIGNDIHGEMYVEELKKHKVISRLSKHFAITGHALSFITPDSQRTFSVHLGAAINISSEDILEEDIATSKILHLEGYQLEGKTRETVLYAMEIARRNNTLISLDLSDPGVIRRNKSFLQKVVLDYVDILFVNEDEAFEFTGAHNESAARMLGEQVKIVIVKLGKKGSLICSEGKITSIAPFTAKAIDTTGAGDTFAAGFLYGYCQGWSLEKAGKLGSLFASKVVEQKGVRLLHFDGEGLKRLIS